MKAYNEVTFVVGFLIDMEKEHKVGLINVKRTLKALLALLLIIAMMPILPAVEAADEWTDHKEAKM